jgi:arginyl-tRNA synthetase
MPGLVPLVEAAFAPLFDQLRPGAPALVRVSQRADYQVDGALPLAKALGRPPREVAEEVLAKAWEGDLAALCEKAEVAGPGFINLTVSAEAMAAQLAVLRPGASGLGAPRPDRTLRVVVDYGGPNAAKQMHVGHLRSSIIGDAIVRMLEAVGHEVVRENHIGDWGANFGMLVEHLVDLGEDRAAHELAMGDLEGFYQAARAAYEADPGFAERARARVVMLQSGEPGTMALWRSLVDASVNHFDQDFHRLGVKLSRDDVVGESYYNPMLDRVVSELSEAGLLVESDGALCVFPPGFANRDGAPLPLIVRNSAGGYTYAATDLAAVRDRTERLRADLVVYVVGLPQSQHLAMVFEVARMAGWLTRGEQLVHVGFGNVLGPDGKMFRTRQGGTVKLSELLAEAEERARSVVVGRTGGTAQDLAGDVDEVVRAVGTGAIKYADLSTDRVRDYRFDWDRMLSLDGNTAPYIQYAHARVLSIFRRAGEATRLAERSGDFLPPADPEERELAKALLSFGEAFADAVDGFAPHKLCGYLFDLASQFTRFYEKCPVLNAPAADLVRSRLALCAATGAVLATGLDLLGIQAPERM